MCVRVRAKRFCCPHLYGDFFVFLVIYIPEFFLSFSFSKFFDCITEFFCCFINLLFPYLDIVHMSKEFVGSCIALKSNLVIF